MSIDVASLARLINWRKISLPIILIAAAAAWADSVGDFMRMTTLLLLAVYTFQHVKIPTSIFWTVWNGFLYCAIAAGTFFIGNYKEGMTTAGTHLFYVAIGVQIANALKSFTDTSLSKFLAAHNAPPGIPEIQPQPTPTPPTPKI